MEDWGKPTKKIPAGSSEYIDAYGVRFFCAIMSHYSSCIDLKYGTLFASLFNIPPLVATLDYVHSVISWVANINTDNLPAEWPGKFWQRPVAKHHSNITGSRRSALR